MIITHLKQNLKRFVENASAYLFQFWRLLFTTPVFGFPIINVRTAFQAAQRAQFGLGIEEK